MFNTDILYIKSKIFTIQNMFSIVAKRAFTVAATVGGAAAFTTYNTNYNNNNNNKFLRAHCQVPCGIYDDSGRIDTLKEDATTIKKAMDSVKNMGGSYEEDPKNLNQAVRWINTKEQHASHIITTVSEYFLTQKVKDVGKSDANYDDYLIALALHHKVMRLAMKAKQTMDPKVADELQHAIGHLGAYYGKSS